MYADRAMRNRYWYRYRIVLVSKHGAQRTNVGLSKVNLNRRPIRVALCPQRRSKKYMYDWLPFEFKTFQGRTEEKISAHSNGFARPARKQVEHGHLPAGEHKSGRRRIPKCEEIKFKRQACGSKGYQRYSLVLSAVCFCFLTPARAGAQVATADIVGSVTEQSGARVVSGNPT